tara:strand:- start:2031 stop:2396 length:366 start_codon:yes stop_codon:yes gene_type:complete
MFRNLSASQKILAGAGVLLIVPCIHLLGKGLGFLLSNYFEVDISNQVYQILILLSFGSLASVYFFTFKKVRTHIRQIGLRYPSGAHGMEFMHMFQGVFISLAIIWICYTIVENVKEIASMI